MNRNLFIKVILLGILSFSLFVYFLLGKMKEEMVSNTVADLSTIVKTTHNTLLDIWVANLMKDVEAIVQGDKIVEYTEELLLTGIEPDLKIRQQKALSSLRHGLKPILSNHNAKGIFVISPEGKNIASMRDSNLGDQNLIAIDRPDYFRKVLLGESLLIPPIKSDVPLKAPDGKMTPQCPTMFLAVPIVNKNGKVLAIFTIRLDPFGTFSGIAQNARLRRTGETYLFDGNGTIITESRFDDQLYRLGIIQNPKMSLLQIQIRDPGRNLVEDQKMPTKLDSEGWPLTYMAQHAINLKTPGSSVTPYRDYRGVMVYGAWVWSEKYGIGIATEMDMDEALAPYWEMRRLTIILLVGIVLIVTIFIFLLSKQQKQSRNQIRRLYQDLENKYQARTEDLQASELELKISTEKEKRANQVKSDFLANMSHEIRTPMNGILGFADLLRETELDEEQKESVSLIVHSGQSLLVIINDILDLSKIEAGKMSIEKIPMQINAVMDDALKHYAKAAQEKGLALSKKVDSAIPEHIIGDPIRIRQIIFNLISNAIKFTDKGSITLHIKTETTETNTRFLRIEAHDTGIGIDKDKLSNIFESFIQADLSTTRNFGGTGLGLTISQKLVQMMDGKMGVTSDLGKGSCFYFTIPLEGTTIEKTNKERVLPLTRNYHQTIILAEDNLINQKLAIRSFKKLGVEVLLANNGQEAIEWVKKEQHSLIMMDIRMPVLNGIEATKQLRNEGYKKPIIAMTANVMESDIEQYNNIGMEACLPKPFTQQELIHIFDQFLKGS